MPVLLREELYNFMNINRKTEPGAASFHASGPGQYDPWLSIMENDEFCWHKNESAESKSGKPKLILSNAVLADVIPDNADHSLISALIEQFDVYLWPGENSAIRDVLNGPPITSTDEFFHQREKIRLATEKKVQTSLAQYGIAASNFQYMDFAAYQAMKRRYLRTHGGTYYNLVSYNDDENCIRGINESTTDPELERLLDAMDIANREELVVVELEAKQIERVRRIVLRKAPHLVARVQTQMGRNNLEITNLCFNTYEIKTQKKLNNEYTSKKGKTHFATLTTEEKLALKKLTYDAKIDSVNAKKKQARTASQQAQQEKINQPCLDFKDCLSVNYLRLTPTSDMLKSCDLSPLVSLEELLLACSSGAGFTPSVDGLQTFLKNNHALAIKKLFFQVFYLEKSKQDELDCSSFASLEQCSIGSNFDEKGLRRLRFSSQQKIHSLSLIGVKVPELDEKQLPYLKRLSVASSPDFDLSQFNVGRFSQIHDLKIVQCKNSDLTALINLVKLELSECTSPPPITFPRAPGLRQLILKNCDDLSRLDLSLYPDLEELIIENDDNKRINNINLDFQHCRNLKRLTLKGIQNLERVDLSPLSKLEMLSMKCDRLPGSITAFSPNFPNLRIVELEIKECHGAIDLNMSACKNIESLTYTGTVLSQLNCENLVKLKYIKLVSLHNISRDSKLILDGTAALTKLKIEHSLSEGTIEVKAKDCQKLHQLVVSTAQKVTISDLTDCKHLQVVQLDCPKAEIETILTQLPLNCNPDIHVVSPNSDVKKVESPTAKTEKHAPALKSNPREEENKLLEKVRLRQANALNPVACFSLKDDIEVDGDTARSDVPVQVQGDFKLVLEEKDFIDRDKHRIQIYDEVKEEKGKIIFSSSLHQRANWIEVPSKEKPAPFDDNKIAELRAEVHQSTDKGLGMLSGKFSAGKVYPLATSAPMRYLNPPKIYTKPSDAICLFYHLEHEQFYVQLKAPYTEEDVKILYQYKRNPIYDKPPSGQPLERPELRDTPLSKKLAAKIDGNPELKFLSDNKLPLENVIQQLQRYCSQFKDTALTFSSDTHAKKTSPLTQFDLLVMNILQKKGKCRHIAEAFVLLARMRGVPARFVRIESHSYAEVCYADGWHRFELGGSRIIDETPLERRQNLLDVKVVATALPPPKVVSAPQAAAPAAMFTPAPVSVTPMPLMPATTAYEKKVPVLTAEEKAKIEMQAEQQYYQEISSLVKRVEVKCTNDLLGDFNLGPLIELTPGQDPLVVQKLIISELRKRDDVFQHYLYIHSPKDLYLYLSPFCLEKGELTQRDKQGPLADILKNGGALIVNWSNFTAAEMANFKSLLDAEATLLGEPVSTRVKTIGLVTPTTKNCSAFASRCQPCRLLPEFFVPQARTEKTRADDKTVEPIVVDLFYGKDWRQFVFGKINFSGNDIELIPGAIYRGITENRPVVFQCPPDDKEFYRLIEQIKTEGRFFFNGHFIHIPPNSKFDIRIDVAVPEYKAAFDIHLETKEEKAPSSRLVHIGLHNWHECFSPLCIDNKKNQAHYGPGYLKEYKEDQVFYITEPISKAHWRRMLAEMSKMTPPTPRFQFKLAPGASIEGVAENKTEAQVTKLTPAALEKSAARIMTTNDPDFLRTQLEMKHRDSKPLIISISPDTQFQDLIAKTRRVSQAKDKTKVDFSYEEQDMLRALKAGRAVILQGEMSSRLYQQLLPLLLDSPSIDTNGEHVEPSGRLFTVMPAQAAQALKLSRYAECTYKKDDYINAFEKKSEQEQVRTILTFYELAKRLPAGGGYSPPILSYDDVKRMAAVLEESKQVKDEKKQLHPHNPLKGLFAHYPKSTESYAYLNVMGKYLFRPNDRDPMRTEKLKNLMQRHRITDHNLRDYVWQVLNCMNGNALRNLFGSNIEMIFANSSSQPMLTERRLADLWEMIKDIPHQDMKKAEKKESDSQKRKRYLQAAMKSQDVVSLHGPSGTGEREAVREVALELGLETYEGQAQIQAWLKTDRPSVLVLRRDEQPTNLLISSSPQHKIVFLDTTPSHAFFRQYEQTVYSKMPGDEDLKREILQKHFPDPEGTEQDYIRILNVFRLVRESNQTQIYSIFDLENLLLRFKLLLNKADGLPRETKLFQACMAEFAGTIQDVAKRKLFIKELRRIVDIDAQDSKHTKKVSSEKEPEVTLIKISDTISIPDEQLYLVEIIQQAIEMRNRGILLEGESGLGKSTLFMAILKALNKERECCLINAGDNTAAARLLDAFHSGKFVVFEEFNLMNAATKELMRSLLERGRDLNNQPARTAGFMVCASQNSSNSAGRSSTEAWAKQNLQFVYMNAYTPKALAAIAAYYNKPYPERYASAYSKVPDATMRTYYTALKTTGQSSQGPAKKAGNK